MARPAAPANGLETTEIAGSRRSVTIVEHNRLVSEPPATDRRPECIS